MDISEAALIQTIHGLVAAYEKGDIDCLDELVRDDCIIVDEGHLRDKADELNFLARPVSSIKVRMSFVARTTRIHDNCATVVGDLEEIVDSGAEALKKSTFIITDTFVGKDGTWRLATRHQTRIPEDKKEVISDSKLLTGHVGKYGFSSGLSIDVSLIGNKLFAQVPGREKQELHPLSVNEYFATEFDAEVTFVPDVEGEIRTVMLRQAGQLIFAHKLAEAASPYRMHV
jgi:Domain of unknown function (DUF4440)